MNILKDKTGAFIWMRQKMKLKTAFYLAKVFCNIKIRIFFLEPGKDPPEKSPLRRFRGRVRVRLGIGLVLGSGGFFRGDFFLEPKGRYTVKFFFQSIS